MIGPIKTGTLSSAEISAVIHQGFSIKLTDGRAGYLAIIDESGRVVDTSPSVAREVWLVAIASYKNFLVGEGHLRVLSGPIPGIGSDQSISETG